LAGTGTTRRGCGRVAALALLLANVAAPAATEPGAGAAAIRESRFDLLELRVLGNTTLPVREVERAIYPFLGQQKSIGDVESARAALEQAYHERGYGTVFVDIPEQDVEGGLVRLHVTEGRLHSAGLTGARYFSARQIKADIPSARVGSVPNIGQLQSEIATVNARSTDRSVVPVLKAGPVPGTVDLALKVEDHVPIHASLEINNQRTPNTEPLRAIGNLSYDNMFGRLDSFGIQYQYAPQSPGSLAVWALNYSANIASAGERLSFLYVDSNSEVASLGTLGVLGKGQIYGTHLNVPLVASAEELRSFTIGADFKHFLQDVALAGTPGLETPISYVNFSSEFTDALFAEHHRFSFDATANFAVRGLASSEEQFADKRYLGRSNYFYLHASASYDQSLPAGAHLLVRAAGQYAAEPLITNEDFVITGIDGVRGYLEAEELADRGIKGTLQLISPAKSVGSLRADVYAFADGGYMTLLAPLDQPSAASLESIGAGLDLFLDKYATASLIFAEPLKPGVETRAHDARWLFSVRGSL
jgi:hemolysin activation/secretion protein